MLPGIMKYGVAGLLAVLVTVIIITGHSADAGAAEVIGLLGIVITALFTSSIAHSASEKAANGTVRKILDQVDSHFDPPIPPGDGGA